MKGVLVKAAPSYSGRVAPRWDALKIGRELSVTGAIDLDRSMCAPAN
jgi:hypothetical protein